MIRPDALRALMLAVALAVVAAGCSVGAQEREDPAAMRPFIQARQQVEALVDATIARAAPGRRAVPARLDGHLVDCKDRQGRGSVRASWTYAREVEKMDAALGDGIVARTEAFWRERGLTVKADESIPGVSIRDGAASGDYGYELIVNRNDGFAVFQGYTPCYPYDQLPARTPNPAG
jgi:hypothetical protein